jgi:hypothetical protein
MRACNTRFRRRAKQKAPPEGGAKGSLHNCLDFDGLRKADNQIRRRLISEAMKTGFLTKSMRKAPANDGVCESCLAVATAALQRDSCPD